MNKRPAIHLNKHSVKRQFLRHPWIFSNEIETTRSDKGIEIGAIVNVYGFDSAYVGTGFYHPRSLISVRFLSREKEIEINETFFYGRIRKAIEKRLSMFGQESAFGGTFRAVFGEADGLPGLVIDRFQNAWTFEPHSFGAWKQKATIEACIRKLGKELFQEKITPIAFRTDHRAASLEAIPDEKIWLSGIEPQSSVLAIENGIRFPIDALSGQKTGFFFDQRMNRQLYRNWLLNDTQALQIGADIFCHFGSWGFSALQAGAKRQIFVDRSQAALDVVKQVAGENGFSEKVETYCGDALDFLRSQEDAAFGHMAVDPPALIPSKKSLSPGSKHYLEIFAGSMRLLAPNAKLNVSSCSFHLPQDRFEEIVWLSALRSNRQAQASFCGSQNWDHPFLPSFPEGRYLKSMFVHLD